jgi:hypothetical protein
VARTTSEVVASWVRIPACSGGGAARAAACASSAGELATGAESESPVAAVLGVAQAYARNLWFIVRMTVPLMFLAGFLGATVAVFLPQDIILGLSFTLGALVLIAVVGVFLPVPIAFDVVAAGALMTLGLAPGYVMALLFTLGSFSVYSFLIVAGAVGRRAAWLMAATIALLGVLGGAGAQVYHDWQTDRALRILLEEAAAPASPWGAAHAAGHDGLVLTGAGAAVTATPLAPPSAAGATLFQRREAQGIGIDKPVEFTMRDMWPPFWEGRSLSAGDIDGDGDLDLAIASTERGLYLYANDGAGHFSPMGDAGPFATAHVFNAALADLDNDGAPDLVIATYLDGLWSWRNVGGRFGASAPVRLPNRADAPLAMALSLADADGNGFADIAVGNWAAGWYRRIPGEEARNRILWNDGGRFDRFADLPGIPGETLSILWTDLDGDGTRDLVVGNDFDIPDYLYTGDGKGGLAMIDHASGRIPHTTTTTMAVKTGDLTGDGVPEIYLAQIAGRSSGVSQTLKMQPIGRYCDAIEDTEAKAVCTTNMAIKDWYRSGNSFDPTYAGRCAEMTGRYRDECRAMLVKDLAIQKRDPGLCALIPAGQPIPRAYCDLHFRPARTPLAEEVALTHPQILRSNVLLVPNGAGGWADEAEARKLGVGGWSWDTKLGDFDLDGDLDVYIVNGTWVPNEVTPSNLWFVNDGTGKFTERSGPDGLEDYLMTASAVAFDADGDGDEDILTHPVNGPLAFFENGAQGPRIAVELADPGASVLGAVVTVTDGAGRLQRREIQSGGGFMSFDAPRLTFTAADAQALTIRWPDGAETVLNGPLAAGRFYRITRD